MGHQRYLPPVYRRYSEHCGEQLERSPPTGRSCGNRLASSSSRRPCGPLSDGFATFTRSTSEAPRTSGRSCRRGLYLLRWRSGVARGPRSSPCRSGARAAWPALVFEPRSARRAARRAAAAISARTTAARMALRRRRDPERAGGRARSPPAGAGFPCRTRACGAAAAANLRVQALAVSSGACRAAPGEVCAVSQAPHVSVVGESGTRSALASAELCARDRGSPGQPG